MISRCGLAANENGLMVPCYSSLFDEARLPSRIQALTPARFEISWASGLKALLDALDGQGVTKGVDLDRGEAIALRSFVPEPVTIAKPEPLYASVFPAVSYTHLSRRDAARLQSLLRTSQRTLGLTPPPAPAPTGKGGKRRPKKPTARALKYAAALHKNSSSAETPEGLEPAGESAVNGATRVAVAASGAGGDAP